MKQSFSITSEPKPSAQSPESSTAPSGIDEILSGSIDTPIAQPPAETGPMRTATPTAWILVAVNVVVFALELAWGGSDSSLVLYRMGAGVGRTSLAHEPWRIVSAAFLHIGIFHLVLNMWALLVFGRMLEVFLGARRFLVLYTLSAAAGGLASSLFHTQILSAGASGAVWGLMTGQIALIVRLKRHAGSEVVPVRMSTLLQPLVINLLFSLTPGIDMAAHVGGGIAGAGLILSGMIGWERPESAIWRRASLGATLAMATCLTVALIHGRPWELRWPPPLTLREIQGTPIVLPVPGGLETKLSREKNVAIFGDLSSDPIALSCEEGRLDAPVPEQLRQEFLSQMVRNAASKPRLKGESWEKQPHIIQLRLRPAVFSATRFFGGGRMQTWLMVEGPWLIRLDVVLRPDTPANWEALSSVIADGIVFRPDASRSSSPKKGTP
jgi:rhomboid protease GluP